MEEAYYLGIDVRRGYAVRFGNSKPMAQSRILEQQTRLKPSPMKGKIIPS